LNLKNLPRPRNKKGEPKIGKRNNKGQLGKGHPVIKFLADLSHRVHTFPKYLYALKNIAKGQSEMNDIDFLGLKRNYAWWIFPGANLTYTCNANKLCLTSLPKKNFKNATIG
jgi:hypothetical protein